MTYEDEQIEDDYVVPEEDSDTDHTDETTGEEPKEKMVPLSALLAERKKRQNSVAKESQSTYGSYATKKDIQTVLEDSWAEDNPDKVEFIEKNLPSVLKRKPHLKDVISASPNRVKEMYQLAKDFTPKMDSQKIVEENMKKPGASQSSSKEGSLSNVEMLRGMSSKEFREYRNKVRRSR